MSTHLLVPGAGGAATWYWQRVAALLHAGGHDAVAVDLPGADPAAGLPEYAEHITAAAGGRDDIVLVAQSMGAFFALPACEVIAPRALVLVNAMIPLPGEAAGDWWDATDSETARRAAARAGGWPEATDLDTYFLHDVPADVQATGDEQDHDEADIAFGQPCAFARWPDVPTTVLAGREDRFFPLAFQRRVALERLGLEVTPLPGGHLNALSAPEALTAAIVAAGGVPAAPPARRATVDG
ncbi:alpha/beta hydrolase [Baekduia soli]|uniref:Alpha/beta hydrolase n=1 Tax=Baekduia soli TaxID=496014 RepID=A0A5B8U8X5_9ACTN|nr:alpha/beta hydrolase [Baekduia soli]QEC49514.1 alpha/beta hydrolase [Baekduia soli]